MQITTTTTNESLMVNLETTTTMTTTMEDLFSTIGPTTMSEMKEEETTMATEQEETTTSEASTGSTTPANVQGDSSNIIVLKLLSQKSMKSNDIDHIGKNLSTSENIIKLSVLNPNITPTTTTTTKSASNIQTTIESIMNSTEKITLNMKEDYTTPVSTPIITTTNVADITTTVTSMEFSTPAVEVNSATITTTEPNEVMIKNDDKTTTDTSMYVTSNVMHEILTNELTTTEDKMATTINSLEINKKDMNKSHPNDLTTHEEILSTTVKSMVSLNETVGNELITSKEILSTTAYSMEPMKDLNATTTPIEILSTTAKSVESMKELTTITTAKEILSTTVKSKESFQETNKPTSHETTTLRSKIRHSTTTSSRGRMLTTPEVRTTSMPENYAETDANIVIPTENDLIMATNIEEIFGTKMQPKSTTGTDVNVIIAIVVSIVGVIALLLLIGFLYLIRRRQKQTKQSQRCHPVSSDAYSLDNISVFGSMRRKSASGRASKRTYSNAAFDDPSLCHNLLNVHELAKFVEQRSQIFSEFRNIPDITAKITEVPTGCEDKNRFANIVPLPETRVCLKKLNNDETTEYINANYVRGPNDDPKYYIATQAPLESTIEDFFRMIWEQNSRVIIQATDLVENGKDMCYEYLPQSVTLDNSNTFGDFQVILKTRDVRNQYAISTLLLKNHEEKGSRELTHYWYKWPEHGVPTEEAPLIAMLLEVRASLKSYASEELNESKIKNENTQKLAESTESPNGNKKITVTEFNSKTQGPLTVHCSPGTGRTGTIIACDMAMRSLETQKRAVDIPQLVYFIRRGRAGAVKTRDQYELIYKVAKMYATKITTIPHDI